MLLREGVLSVGSMPISCPSKHRSPLDRSTRTALHSYSAYTSAPRVKKSSRSFEPTWKGGEKVRAEFFGVQEPCVSTGVLEASDN
eukprot:3008785-Pyramimonas_sp.AAC.1